MKIGLNWIPDKSVKNLFRIDEISLPVFLHTHPVILMSF